MAHFCIFHALSFEVDIFYRSFPLNGRRSCLNIIFEIELIFSLSFSQYRP